MACASLPSGPVMNIVITLWSASVCWTTDFVYTTVPVMSVLSMNDVKLFVAAS
jgi:hypothetical protein